MTISYEDARTIILDKVSPVPLESGSLLEVSGRVLAEDVIAPFCLPLWDNSAMDGFAVRSTDCRPGVSLAVTGYIPAGGSAEGLAVGEGKAIKIMTGAPLPEGADAIIPIEETDEADGQILIKMRVKAGAHVRIKGEDVSAGELILPAGTLLRSAEISMLASFNRVSVTIFRKVRVAILATGDELVEPGEIPGAGQIINSNSYALAAAVKEAGGEPVLLGIGRDNLASLREKVNEGLKADVLLTSAGVSVGDRDFVLEVLAELGIEQLFSGVLIKPGKPTFFGIKNGNPVFALPGNPVSSLVTFEQFVRPALLKMMGHQRVFKPLIKAELAGPLKKKAGRVFFIRVHAYRDGDRLLATSAGDQNTGVLKTLVKANALAVLPAESEQFEIGEMIAIQMLDGGDLE